jgi:ssDNA thymidine ADP-ribosyltransferase, DarT
VPIPIYHITHIDNLESILSVGGLLAYNVMLETQTNYTNIAYENIQDRRATTDVPCGGGGVLHDYVPYDAIDWDVMKSRYWNDTNEDNDRKRRRQAEFLVRHFSPWQLITEIGVMNYTIKHR